MSAAIGQDVNRVDGPAKVTGAAALLRRDRAARTWPTPRSSAPRVAERPDHRDRHRRRRSAPTACSAS